MNRLIASLRALWVVLWVLAVAFTVFAIFFGAWLCLRPRFVALGVLDVVGGTYSLYQLLRLALDR